MDSSVRETEAAAGERRDWRARTSSCRASTGSSSELREAIEPIRDSSSTSCSTARRRSGRSR